MSTSDNGDPARINFKNVEHGFAGKKARLLGPFNSRYDPKARLRIFERLLANVGQLCIIGSHDHNSNQPCSHSNATRVWLVAFSNRPGKIRRLTLQNPMFSG